MPTESATDGDERVARADASPSESLRSTERGSAPERPERHQRRERRAALGLVAASLGIIATGTGWERARGAGIGSTTTSGATSDDLVLARVPARGADAAAREIERLRASLRAAPRDLAAAVRLARLDLTAARDRADPRFLGRAEAALGPWWTEREAPAEVILLRATIRQARHDFEPALDDLDALVARPRARREAAIKPMIEPATEPTIEPTTLAQAWLTRAVVLGVKARYTEALASCAPLDELATPFVRAACRAPLLGLTGRAAAAATDLAASLDQASGTAELAWGRSLLADLARWSGDDRGAEALLRSVLAIAPTDGFARAALADLLLDGGRTAEAAALLAGHEDDDALLLRLALAEAQPAAARGGAVAAMAARFRASRERGDVVHRREEARFVLAVEHDPTRALRLALANWEVQREPADARVLLEASLAAAAPAAARPALDWLDATNLAWPRLRELAAALRSAS